MRSQSSPENIDNRQTQDLEFSGKFYRHLARTWSKAKPELLTIIGI